MPRQAPSICIAAYDRGHPSFYLLRDLRPDQVEVTHTRTGTVSRFGGLLIEASATRLGIEIDVPIRGGDTLTGSIEIDGTAVRMPEAGPALHRWGPRIVGPGRAALKCGRWAQSVHGRAYHDRNASSLGLSELGIRRWIWGRTPQPDGEVVHYLLEPLQDRAEQNHVLRIDWDGAVEHQFVEVERGRERRGKWGVYSPIELRAGDLHIVHEHPFEDGPFYQRYATQVTGPDGKTREGVGEVVDTDRMDRGWYRPLVDMALDGPSPSMWVPLFAGPSAGGFMRLMRSWTTG